MAKRICVTALIAGLAMLGTVAAAQEQSWPLEDLNRAIEQTNFVVDGVCSGTLISLKEKLILTNYHCVADHITSIEREVTDSDGLVKKVRFRKYEDVPVVQEHYDGFVRTGSSSFITEIVAETKTSDLALIKVKGDIPHTYASPLLPEGKSVTRGEKIYVVGNPKGADSSVVDGVVSNVNRAYDFPWTDGARLPVIQFSGGIIGGNSGGALYNVKGELIGVPAVVVSSATFMGFAIPIHIVKAFVKENCYANLFDAKADDKACRDEKAKRAARAKRLAEKASEEGTAKVVAPSDDRQ